MTAPPSTQINVADMCAKHQRLLIWQAHYKPRDPWRALVIVSQVALFQATTCDPKAQARLGGDLTRFPELGCLACLKPDAFGEIVEAAKTHDLGRIKLLGEAWVHAAALATGVAPKHAGSLEATSSSSGYAPTAPESD